MSQSRYHLARTTALLLLALVGFHCSDEGTEPPPPDNLVDTTSHNFTFTLDTLGDGNSSVLYDVAIIDETDAWAVGEIYIKDSTGQIDPNGYSAAHWNGNKWQLRRFYYHRAQGDSLLIAPIRGILILSSNDIWFAAGSIFHWNGSSVEPFLLRGTILSGLETVEKLWGISGTDLYGVGNAGTIVHYNGSSWGKIESGMMLSIRDIWGERNSLTGQLEILALASNKLSFPVGKKLLRIQGTTVTTVSDSGLSWSLSGLWFGSDKNYFIVGDGIYYTQNLNSSTVWSGGANIVTTFYTNAVRGNSPNDLFVVGSFGEVLHFNGSSWRSFHQQTKIASGSYWSVSMRGNVVVAVGDEGDRAIIARGRR